MLLGGTLVPGLASTHEFAFNCTICCTSNCMGIIIKNWNQPMEMKTQGSSMQEGLSNSKKWAAALRVTGICSVLMCILRLIYGKKVCGEMGKCKERGFSCNKNIRWVQLLCVSIAHWAYYLGALPDIRSYRGGGVLHYTFGSFVQCMGGVLYSICLPTKTATIILKYKYKYKYNVWWELYTPN